MPIPNLDLRKQIGRRIKNVRLEKHWSQEEFGQRCWGTKASKAAGAKFQPRIAQYENAITEISFSDLERLSHVAGVAIVYFFADGVQAVPEHELPLVTWSELMRSNGKHSGKAVRVPIPDDSARGFLKGQIVEVDPKAPPKHGNFVIVSHKREPFMICEFFHHKGRKYFKSLNGTPRNFDFDEKNTYIFGVIISQTIYHR